MLGEARRDKHYADATPHSDTIIINESTRREPP